LTAGAHSATAQRLPAGANFWGGPSAASSGPPRPGAWGQRLRPLGRTFGRLSARSAARSADSRGARTHALADRAWSQRLRALGQTAVDARCRQLLFSALRLPGARRRFRQKGCLEMGRPDGRRAGARQRAGENQRASPASISEHQRASRGASASLSAHHLEHRKRGLRCRACAVRQTLADLYDKPA